jgi:hypothetical protein
MMIFGVVVHKTLYPMNAKRWMAPLGVAAEVKLGIVTREGYPAIDNTPAIAANPGISRSGGQQPKRGGSPKGGGIDLAS